jgi:hypothetical protein
VMQGFIKLLTPETKTQSHVSDVVGSWLYLSR